MDRTHVKLDGDLEYQALRQLLKLVAQPEDQSAAARLRGAIDEELTARQREYVEKYYILQMQMPQIAQSAGVSVSTVSRTVKRGRARLVKCLRYAGRGIFNE